jgi:hypothetical protein
MPRRALSATLASGLEFETFRRLLLRPARLGDPLRVDFTYRDVPPGSGLVVEVVHDPEPGFVRSPDMPYAPLTRRPIPASESGVLPAVWDGGRRLCASSDIPMWRPAVAGRSRIRATRYALRSRGSGDGRLAPRPPPTALARIIPTGSPCRPRHQATRRRRPRDRSAPPPGLWTAPEIRPSAAHYGHYLDQCELTTIGVQSSAVGHRLTPQASQQILCRPLLKPSEPSICLPRRCAALNRLHPLPRDSGVFPPGMRAGNLTSAFHGS